MLVIFLIVIIAFYFQGKRYAVKYAKEEAPPVSGMAVKVRPLPAAAAEKEIVPPPVVKETSGEKE